MLPNEVDEGMIRNTAAIGETPSFEIDDPLVLLLPEQIRLRG
jgi:hypothetical protein